jgi:predicted O-methyltransferase YrrM
VNSLVSHSPQLAWNAPRDSTFELLEPNIATLQTIFQSKCIQGASGREIPLNVFIPPAEGNLLYSLVRYLRPLHCLEIGLANGISATYIAQALQDNQRGAHLAIDPFQTSDWDDAGLTTLRRAQLDQLVTLKPALSHWVLPQLEQQAVRVQFAFIDGSHLFDYVMTDFLGVDRILDVGGLIAWDDSDWPSITRVIRFALTNRDYRVLDTGTVIEPSGYHPRWVARVLRAVALRWPSGRRIFRPDFLFPSHQLGISGRCIVLQKLSNDLRDNQKPQLAEF